MGHTTHGLQLLAPYVDQLMTDKMKKEGDPTIVQDCGASVTWVGNRLPGPWLIDQAIQLCMDRLSMHPVVTLVIQQSHHIACLAAYLEQVTAQGKIIILASSDPGNKTVAPFGGTTGVYSPNPLSYGIPTESDPILFDSSASTLANGVVMQKHSQGESLDGAWLMDSEGALTDDPNAFFEDPPATILPTGGLTLGFKGFGLGILIEALTSGLSGSGRRDHSGEWSASIFLQIIDPSQFGGEAALKAEMQHFVDASLKSKGHPNFSGVRMPGHRGLTLKRKQLKEGIQLHPSVLKSIQDLAIRQGIPLE